MFERSTLLGVHTADQGNKTTAMAIRLVLLILVFITYVIHCNAKVITDKNPFHPEFVRGKGDNKGTKVLVVVVDNRHLHDSIDGSTGFGSLVAVLQSYYCKHHGYDYVRIVNDKTGLREEVAAKYPGVVNEKFQERTLDTIGDPKHGFDVLHPGYLRTRSSSWGKLPALWHTAQTIGKHYDYIWFMDSDATPNPMNNDLSLSDALDKWDGNTTQSVKWGKAKPSNATFLFMSNFPYRDDLPCAGTIVIKPSQYALDAIREWWDFDLIYKARDDFMEQDALWYLIEAGPQGYQYMINDQTTVVLTEQQFSSAWRGYSDIWFAHIPSGEEYRAGYFRTMLNVINIRTEEQFFPLIDFVKTNNVLILPFLNISEAMEALHEKPYRTHRPPENAIRSKDMVWHAPQDLHLRPAPPPPGTLYNGFAVHMDGQREVYLVYNNERHLFATPQSMQTMGFYPDCVLRFHHNHMHPTPHRIIQNIPEGAPVPEEGVVVRITPHYVLRPVEGPLSTAQPPV